MASWWLWLVLAYLCGSVPFGLLLALSLGVDIRKAGSGNVGATNVGRVLGRKWGMLCVTLDALKAMLPVLAAGWAMHLLGRTALAPVEAWAWLGVAAAAVLGHVFPVWLKFKGGKGVATCLGVVLGMYPILTIPGLVTLAIWLLFAGAFRYVSLASIVACFSMAAMEAAVAFAHRGDLAVHLANIRAEGPVSPPLAWAMALGRWEHLPMALVTTLLALLVLGRHRSNIRRLLGGTELRLGEQRAAAATSATKP
jgi:glycerol-3-phosphate acyltransferase PlsY